MQDPELWARLEAFRFDAETGSQPFSVKLATEEGWTPDQTARVIEEYRRFLYLTQISGAEATPSIAVDRAWHMHLTFTRSYWDGLCQGVLNRPLHHDPCTGSEDMPRYEAQYAASLRLYMAEFAEIPPSDIWPTTAAVDRDVTPGGDASAPAYVWGLGAGLPLAFASMIGLVVAGPTPWVIAGLLIAGIAISLGVSAYPRRADVQTGRRGGTGGGGVFAAGCGTSTGGGKSHGGGDGDGGAGCGGGGCGGGGGG